MEPQRAFYAGDVPARASRLLQEAISVYADTARAENLLKQAQREAPEALSVYFSLYKFYFYKGDLERAEQSARQALETAARQGGFSDDYPSLMANTVDWTRHDGPGHFYLFSLKALAFIRLRRGDKPGCEQILQKLAELDSADTVGASVIGSIAAGV
jgi:tetratricopeptide (TPR) repeat protein